MLAKNTIREAERRIRPHIRRTPVLEADGVLFKLEFMQHAGSFKTRGAFANLLARTVPAAGRLGSGSSGCASAHATEQQRKRSWQPARRTRES